MKKYLSLLIFIAFTFILPVSWAAGTANIRINITGSSNSYLCLNGTGCLLIVPGKTYPILHQVNLKTIYILDARTRRVAPQAPNASCDKTLKRGQTITIYGHLNDYHVSGLHCSVR